VECVDRVDYGVDPARAQGFYAAIRRYWPGLPDGALVPAYAGIRPRTRGPGGPAEDFIIQGHREVGTLLHMRVHRNLLHVEGGTDRDRELEAP